MKRFPFNKNNKRKNTFIILLIFLILTLLEFIFFYPKIKIAIKESNAIELINKAKQNKKDSNMRDYTLFFISMDNSIISFDYRGTKRYSLIHDSFEYQLKSPQFSALDRYCVTFIPENTKLIGATLKNKALYINVSKEILESKNFTLCYRQLKAQAFAINKEAKFYLLVEGNLYDENKNIITKYS